jgi:site-specific DNA recombinase
MEGLRKYTTREGYEVLEEVVDPGQSGASLERPGMDRVRNLVAPGGVSVVLAQDRDRFSREPAYSYLLRREFEESGTKLRALNDRGDEIPEGQLTDGILDQLAKYQRASIARATSRGKLRKAREGRILRGPKPPYGFRYNTTQDGLVLYEPEMLVVEKVFRMAVSGLKPGSIQTRLYAEGVPSPTGKDMWQRQVIRRIVDNDIYLPYTHDEIDDLVSPEVAARLDPAQSYALWWFGRHAVTAETISEPDVTVASVI